MGSAERQKQDPAGWLDPVLCGHQEKNLEGLRMRGLGLPVFVVAQKIVFVPVIHCGFQEQPAYAEMSHLLEAAVGGVDAAADDAETLALDLLAEKVVLGKKNLLMKST